MLHDLQGLGSPTTIMVHFSEAWDRASLFNLPRRRRDLKLILSNDLEVGC
jgi:hypothetical protein